MNHQLTVIISSRNEGRFNLWRTIRSILQDDPPVRVIVVDDASETPEVIPHDERVSLIRNETSLGVGASRHVGVLNSDSEWIMFTDAHMSFPRGWWGSLLPHLRVNFQALLSSTYISDYDWGKSQVIQGSEFTWYRRSLKDGQPVMILCELEPLPGYRSISPIDTQMVMGAGYFIRRKWYDHIGGLSALIGYGMDEQWMCWNSWLCGGQVITLGDVPIIHHFMHGRTRQVDGHSELRNRLVLLQQILTDDEYSEFVTRARLDGPEVLISLGSDLWPGRAELKARYKRDHQSICQWFKAPTYQQALQLMD